MICLLDTDITLKLSACRLLQPALTVLGANKNEVYVLREEAYRVYTRNQDVITAYPASALKNALKFINDAHRIEDEPDPDEQYYMSLVDNIDSGEQILYGATRNFPDFRLLTADRKALLTISKAFGCEGICARLKGRVVCLEQILLRLIPVIGYEVLRGQVVPFAARDTAFKLPFQGAEKEAVSELNKLILQLQNDACDLLLPVF